MSTVAQSIKNELRDKAEIQSEIIHSIDFYVPLRGNMRRQRSRASSLVPDNEDQITKQQIYKEISEIDTVTDFDDPKQMDFDLMVKGLRLLTEERLPFNKPVYDKFLKIRTDKTVTVMPHPVIIVEGALIFCNEELRQHFDLSVWIDTDDDVRLSRRVLKNEKRDGPRKVPLADLLQIYEDKTKPAFEKFIEPTKKFANTIIPNYGFTTEKLNVEKMSVMGVDLVVTHVINTVSQR